MRNTIQRQIILEYLNSSHVHASANTIYEKVKEKVPTISRATVYQNLQRLLNEKKVTKVEAGTTARFEATRKAHHHFHCQKCHNLFDIPDTISQPTKSSLKKLAKKHSVAEVNLILTGTCYSCS